MGFFGFILHAASSITHAVGGAVSSAASAATRAASSVAHAVGGVVGGAARTAAHLAVTVGRTTIRTAARVAAPAIRTVTKAAAPVIEIAAPVVTPAIGTAAGMFGLGAPSAAPSTTSTYHTVASAHSDAAAPTFAQKLEVSLQTPEVLVGALAGAVTGFLGGGSNRIFLGVAGAAVPVLAHAAIAQ